MFHAGDGNVHPILMFDERDPVQVKKVLDASHEILAECIRLGGSVTGEHGIGVEKIDFMPLMFTPDDLHYMVRLRTALQPREPVQPGKMLPDRGRLRRADDDRADQGGAAGGGVNDRVD